MASTYAAAPGPEEVKLKEDVYTQDEGETSHALFMSGHFVFPPSQHENLLVEPDYSEILDESGSKDVPVGKDEENLTFTGLNASEEFEGMPYFDETISRLSVHGKQFEEGATLHGFGLTGEEETMYDSAKYTSFHSGTDIGCVVACGESIIEAKTPELVEQGSNVCPDLSLSTTTPTKDDRYSPLDLPCGAWWKRRAFRSVCVAATVMGVVMVGHHWQQERFLQLKWLNVNGEPRSRVLVTIYRLKDMIVGSHRPVSLIRGGSSGES
ncbi:ATG8-interacting protein 1 isoform X2 [Arachis ipaensis]|nr:ATG8-interacting protein 1 isoform X2 [Arachis ipaensis]XP_020965180.1 ATG8-interacting protein 1 isoform X2 [Arachis ipaensis]XP_020965181.1 ATG8-interacting protein 1 isoform X2 [Arachis ipaensis]